ncbi:hypothetical protein JW979_06000, partial [bacterium]|nr:hypothetical protein [candidate division CSSED10-310 bacterium]
IEKDLTISEPFGPLTNFNASLFIGSSGVLAPDTFMNGWMDEIRITKGYARWTDNFDVPEYAFELENCQPPPPTLTPTPAPTYPLPTNTPFTPPTFTPTTGPGTPTNTPIPSWTPTSMPTNTAIPSWTPPPTFTPTTGPGTPTNTPIPSWTPIPPTFTPTPTPPPTFSGTATPPSPTNTPTRTPTPVRTATITPTITPPTPTPECNELGVTLEMPSNMFHAGDPCGLKVHICNTTGYQLGGYPLFAILEVYGDFYCAPSWISLSDGFDYYHDLTFAEGLTIKVIIPEFAWPDCTGSASGIRFWAAMTDPSITGLFGNYDLFEFGWDTSCNTSTPTPLPTEPPNTPTPTPPGNLLCVDWPSEVQFIPETKPVGTLRNTGGGTLNMHVWIDGADADNFTANVPEYFDLPGGSDQYVEVTFDPEGVTDDYFADLHVQTVNTGQSCPDVYLKGHYSL